MKSPARLLAAASILASCLLPLGSCNQHEKGVQAYELAGGNWRSGRDKIEFYGCGSCHTIPGVNGARGLVGPPLTAFARRVYVGGVVPNTPDNLVNWIRNPRAIDSLTAMPNLNVSREDARDIATYLYTLQ